FSSRRRHTRSKRDWSSDVCSSDLGNFHVQQAQESTAETKAQRDGGFWLVGQGGIVKLKLLQRITQSREICLRNWEQARVHHWLRSEERRVGKECRCRWGAKR